jgi:uncharacterized protein (TIGR03435 family)
MNRNHVFLAIGLGILHAQVGPPADTPSFEVASIKLKDRPGGGKVVEDAGQIHYPGTSLMNLVRLAYGVVDAQITGPGFLDDQWFDLIAKIPASASKDHAHQIPLMLQSLLRDRIQMTMHRDRKSMQVYALVVGSKGLKIQESADKSLEEGCVSAYVAGGPNAYQCHVTMVELATELPPFMLEGVPVVDHTELTGIYDFKLSYTGRVMLNFGQGGVSIYDALQQQLGLKLEPRKEMVDSVVIDHIEKLPTAN